MRGHKLLKNKQDEMTRILQDLVRQRDALRATVSAEVARAVHYFMDSRARMSPTEVDNAIRALRHEYEVNAKTKNIMGLEVPVITLTREAESQAIFATTPQSFERAVHTLQGVMDKLVALAGIQKSCAMIERNLGLLRQRINALEYSVIPGFTKNIREITLKLSENERGNLVRLMKVKEVLENQGEN